MPGDCFAKTHNMWNNKHSCVYTSCCWKGIIFQMFVISFLFQGGYFYFLEHVAGMWSRKN